MGRGRAIVKRMEIGRLYRVGTSRSKAVFPANGKKFTLPELQKLVGGYIEAVPHATPIAYCNEEGRLDGLPFNKSASVAFKQVLVGDVIQVSMGPATA